MADLGEMTAITVSDLESCLGSARIAAFVHDAEMQFLDQTVRIADRIAWDCNLQAVFISGPTASGKTTFTHRLASALAFLGRPTCLLSMDDYYEDKQAETDERGRPDFESIDMLDTALMMDQIQMLLDGYEVHVPHFDMVERRRIYTSDRIRKIPPGGILLVEGLHGLSPVVLGSLERQRALGVFIMPFGTLLDSNRLLQPREIRMLRRISRDSHHRGASAMETLDYWPVIDRAEQAVFPSYLATADVFVNSLIPYEFCVIPHLAAECIRDSLAAWRDGRLEHSVYLGGKGFAEAARAAAECERLLTLVDRIPRLAVSNIPDMSILNEFIR